MQEAHGQLAEALQQHRVASDKVLLDAVLLLQPALPARASILEPPQPPASAEDDDEWWGP